MLETISSIIIGVILWSIFLSFVVLAAATAYLWHLAEDILTAKDYIDETRTGLQLTIGATCAALGVLALFGIASSEGNPLTVSHLTGTIVVVLLAIASYAFWGKGLLLMYRILHALEHDESMDFVEGKVRTVKITEEASKNAMMKS